MKISNPFVLKLILFVLLFFLFDFCLGHFLLKGLNRYYGIGENSEIALVGHSHLMLGIDKVKMEDELGKKVSKYTREGVNVINRKMMVDQLLVSNQDMSTLIYGVDAWTFTSEGLSDNSYKLFYPFMGDQTIEDYVYNNSGLIDYLTKMIISTTRYDELLISSSLRGYFGNWTNLKIGSVDVKALKANIAIGKYRKIENAEHYIGVFEETLETLSRNNVNVILLCVPTIDSLNEVQELKYKETLSILKKKSHEFDNVEFLNLQEPWSHNYKLFYDPIHLNPEGQAVITDELIRYLKDRYHN